MDNVREFQTFPSYAFDKWEPNNHVIKIFYPYKHNYVYMMYLYPIHKYKETLEYATWKSFYTAYLFFTK